ncbi:MAG: hypothetical protein PQ612_09750 [Rickettsiales bacterium]|nr:hypothetical protein [Pseudomonadota bacterium]MDA0966077.1 hypothetical protein [Pseudomonadota bacterium]MDG4544259.1 hypothetical protein [Rickettsiales bacterium]MDG4546438.1 hypothetical protein [Rickettsiales bacterium]MDG4548584.1 hypothetical protein [Rickettsiales bacterium]
MSIKIIEEQIYRFLKSDTPEVIAIRGAWGVGKTYAWETYLKEAQKKSEIALDRYAYVSLFGVNSLDALKFAIFEKSIDKKLIGEKPELKTFVKNCIPFIEDVSKVIRADALMSRALSFLSVKKAIICFDDFERMRLDAQDVLGLISELKEQKLCKIVLIFNDEGLSDDAKAKYDTYKEKVIDKEFNFLPTAQESAEIVFSKTNEQYSEKLQERCCKLGITNIRILKKIQQLAKDLKPFLENKEEETKHNALSSLVLFTYALYKKSDKFPEVDFIKKQNVDFISFMIIKQMGNKEKQIEDTPEEKKIIQWRSILEDYGYSNSDELDIEIANSVERGYFIEENITKEIKKYDDNIIINKKDKSLTDAWNLYHYSFDDNHEEVVKKMYEAVKNHAKHISQSNLSASIKLLRDLGADKKADELIELAISSNNDPEYFNINHYTFRHRVEDQKMLDRFAEEYRKKRPQKTLIEVLERLISTSGWSMDDVEVLANSSEEDYYNLFKSKKSNDLTNYIRACLQFRRVTNSHEQEKYNLIVTNTEAAVRKIGSESELNKLRINKFEIKDTVEVEAVDLKP